MDKYCIENPRFLVVITGYNCEQYVKKCFDSIEEQSYHNFIISIVNDASTDKTAKAIDSWGFFSPIHYTSNKENIGTYNSRIIAIDSAKNEQYDIIVLLDMDDSLLPNALERVADEYRKGKWMTYGNYIFPNGKKCPVPMRFSEKTHQERSYRRDTWRCTHLRTFRKELYALANMNLLNQDLFPDGDLLFSMMEMCGKERIGVIEEPIYVYTADNPISTLKRFGDKSWYRPRYYEICNKEKRELITDL